MIKSVWDSSTQQLWQCIDNSLSFSTNDSATIATGTTDSLGGSYAVLLQGSNGPSTVSSASILIVIPPIIIMICLVIL